MATIVLAHGLFGFGAPPFGLPSFVNYFNGVARHLKSLGHDVEEPQVNPIGSVADRGKRLAAAIAVAAKEHGEPVHVIAHSMGGLDARYAISNVFKGPTPVNKLTTIGTPHFGSPVADAIANPADPLFAHIPAMLLIPLQTNAGALHDLTTGVGRNFDKVAPDMEGVTYVHIAGDASRGGPELFFFQLAAAISTMKGEINDGVVTRSSALRLTGGEPPKNVTILPDWPGDHASEIGWTLTLESSHLDRYAAIAR
jgi:triacylglycerol lipase